jgi:hypothetical protein
MGLVTRPEVLTIVIVILVLLVIAFLLARPQKAKKTTQDQVPTSSPFHTIPSFDFDFLNVHTPLKHILSMYFMIP